MFKNLNSIKALALGAISLTSGVAMAEQFLYPPNPSESTTQYGFYDVARSDQYNVVSAGIAINDSKQVRVYENNGNLAFDYSLDQGHFNSLGISQEPEFYIFGWGIAANWGTIATGLAIEDTQTCAVLLARKINGTFENRLNTVIHAPNGCDGQYPTFGTHIAMTGSHMFITGDDDLYIYSYNYSANTWGLSQTIAGAGGGGEVEADGDRLIVRSAGTNWSSNIVRIFHKNYSNGQYQEKAAITVPERVIKVDISGDRAAYTVNNAIKVYKYNGNSWNFTDSISGEFGYGAALAMENHIIAVGQANNQSLPDGGVRIFEDRWNGWTELNFYKHENSGESMGYAVELKNGMLLTSAILADQGEYTWVGGAWLTPLWQAINY